MFTKYQQDGNILFFSPRRLPFVFPNGDWWATFWKAISLLHFSMCATHHPYFSLIFCEHAGLARFSKKKFLIYNFVLFSEKSFQNIFETPRCSMFEHVICNTAKELSVFKSDGLHQLQEANSRPVNAEPVSCPLKIRDLCSCFTIWFIVPRDEI